MSVSVDRRMKDVTHFYPYAQQMRAHSNNASVIIPNKVVISTSCLTRCTCKKVLTSRSILRTVLSSTTITTQFVDGETKKMEANHKNTSRLTRRMQKYWIPLLTLRWHYLASHLTDACKMIQISHLVRWTCKRKQGALCTSESRTEKSQTWKHAQMVWLSSNFYYSAKFRSDTDCAELLYEPYHNQINIKHQLRNHSPCREAVRAQNASSEKIRFCEILILILFSNTTVLTRRRSKYKIYSPPNIQPRYSTISGASKN